MMQAPLEQTEDCILSHWSSRQDLSSSNCPDDLKQALSHLLTALESAQVRIAEPEGDTWVVNSWVKQGILLYFCTHTSAPLSAGCLNFFDKVPLQTHWDERQVRVVPPATVRRGAFLGPNAVLMPSYVNIGAYIGANTMVDTWATIGSGAQIGAHVHISGGVGIGGVLEPLQAAPTVIEDNCFIGARSEVVEGVRVCKGAVLGMGVFLGQSTRIYDRTTHKVHYGVVPPDAVVVPGTLPSQDGSHSLAAAIIVKYADMKTRQKVGLNALLRDSE